MRIGKKVGVTTNDYNIYARGNILDISHLEKLWSETLEEVYPTDTKEEIETFTNISFDQKSTLSPLVKTPSPKVLIPVFPGTNCEYDTARAFEKYGANTEILVIRNRMPEEVEESAKRLAKAIKNSHIVALPGGFSGGDEPDGSAKFIVSLLRNPRVAREIKNLLNKRDGLMCGICNGFQALVKLGLVPYGKITEPNENSPTLTFNKISRHQSRLVHTRIASNKSPWLMHTNVGDIHTIAISHGEGRFILPEKELKKLIKNGQIATQYVDLNGNATSDLLFNPNGSTMAIEGITSPDGRVFGKMGHTERFGPMLYKNVPEVKEQLIFKGAVD